MEYLKRKAMKNERTVIDQIRNDQSAAIQNRRKIGALAAMGIIDFSLITLFQLGYIKKLPDLPGKVFDTHKVNTSEDAVLLGLPDGVIGLGGYAAIMFLAMAGSRFKKYSKWIDLALGAVVAGQAAGGANYMVNMAVKQKKICVYCVTGAAVNLASLKPAYALIRGKNR